MLFEQENLAAIRAGSTFGRGTRLTRDSRISRPWPAVGLLLAIGITTTMDATGLAVFSALPLLPLFGLLWYLQRLSRAEVGLVWGRSRDYRLAILYPIIVLGLAVVIAAATGAVDTSDTDWRKTGLNLILMSTTTILMVLLTEEGFFRGWLWASLRRSGLSDGRTLVWTSVFFAIWHWSAVCLPTGFDLPPPQIPVYLVNAALMGAAWGLLRSISGSILVASVSHGLWNGFAYSLFGFGPMHGALGIEPTVLYGPEVGLVGLFLNSLWLVGLWKWWKREH